ncbi:hypothetical protein FDP51_14690 [Enterococcus mundtii]|uniref:hypothetical protein n=1 Tax=Enterococcus mundtii TaxID=53346 RepID=UPI00129C8F4C|nr:hypothetical protein [Enterococcus mundtii]MRI75193.1 hypothetical protein [Enterococcus mundtii]
MKKIFFSFICLIGFVSIGLLGSEVQASSTIPNSYYHIRPVSNKDIFVNNSNFSLTDTYKDFNKYKVDYLDFTDGYIFYSQWGHGPVSWTGKQGLGNLVFAETNNLNNSNLWTIDKVPGRENQYFIRSKQDPGMVWDVHNGNASVGGKIKLERQHPENSPQREFQYFMFTE